MIVNNGWAQMQQILFQLPKRGKQATPYLMCNKSSDIGLCVLQRKSRQVVYDVLDIVNTLK